MRLRLEIGNDRARLGELLRAIDRALAEQGIAREVRDDLQLVAEEVVCNAIDHGLDDTGDDAAISVDIARDGDRLDVEFRDNGRPFDPLAQAPPDLDAGILDRPVGGLGLHLVREFAEVLSYRREEPCNILRVTLRANRNPPTEAPMDLQIHIDPAKDKRQRVAIGGRLDTNTCAELDRRLVPVLASDIDTLVLDLAGLDYISSAGLRSIFKARKALAARNGKVLVLNPQAQIRKVFDVVKAVPMGEIFTSNEELDAYLDAMQRKVLRGDDED